ncbi:MAG: methionine--tRNA ligase [Myxococcales bacterium]|nr:methionine--tRNA ligase [Myxococcales bacterium]
MTTPSRAPFYITTPIYYVNDVPHLGHAYTTLVADALARFARQLGRPTRFLTGTDEHGQKIEATATARGISPQQHVDDVAPRFAACWDELGIVLDDFIRTTEPRHKKTVAALWQRIAAKGDLYLASYEGWYCVGCEAFYTESQLDRVDDAYVCTTHKKPVTWVAKEPSYFFAMSKYQDALLAHIEAHPNFILPEQYRNEVLSFVRGGLRDLSVSRTSFSWGIPVPGDPAHVIYVWMDALTNYMSALGDIDGEGYKRWWPAQVHLIGKDILRFHAVYWPCFLLAAGLPLPETILTHGWWAVRGEKISKSLPATRVDPLVVGRELGALCGGDQRLGLDALRYYLMREVPLGNDGDFTYESLLDRFNADLANDLGNLVSRSLTMIRKFGVGAANVPATSALAPVVALTKVRAATIEQARLHFERFEMARGLEAIWRYIAEANRFVDATAPWTMAKQNDPALPEVLAHLAISISSIAALIAAVMPRTAGLMAEFVGQGASLLWPAVALPTTVSFADVRDPTPLFPRLDAAKRAATIASLTPAQDAAAPVAIAQEAASAALTRPIAAARTPAAPAVAAASAPITFDEFGKIELRVGRILEAQAVPKAKKLLQLLVDVGEATPRTIVAGIAERYQPSDLPGKQVIVVANLAPATIRGIRSEGMLLAAGDETIAGLGAIDGDAAPGTRVR